MCRREEKVTAVELLEKVRDRTGIKAATKDWIQTKVEFCPSMLNNSHKNSRIETSIACEVISSNLDVVESRNSTPEIFFLSQTI